MPFCPQCGAPNAADAAFCGTCGFAIPSRAPSVAGVAAPVQDAPAPAKNLQRTMLGVASPLPASPSIGATLPSAPTPVLPQKPEPAPTVGRAKLQQTMLGFAAPTAVPVAPTASPAPQPAPVAPVPPTPAVAARPNVGAKTMLGIVAPTVPLAAPTKAAPPTAAAAPGAGGVAKRTLLGMPAPAIPSPAPPRGKGQTLVGFQSPAPAGKRTLLGIALPALAPAPPAEPEYVEEYYDEVVPETGEVERRVRRVPKPLPPLHRRAAFWVLVGAALLLASGVGVVLLVRSPAPLTGQPRLDADGKEVLHVTCASCPDGTKLALASARAVVTRGEADVPLAKPLEVGPNKLPLTVERPSGRSETVALDVPVAYRIWPELASLEDPVPSVRVMVEAIAGSAVTVQGKPVSLGEGGRGVTKIDVSEQLSGLSREARSLERDISYTVATKGRPPESGKLSIRVGIASLSIESPGPRMVTESPTFMLAGRTAKGGGLLVAGRPIAVGADGAFAQLMNISAIGSTEVELRASAPPLAPRLAKLTVKRVASLAAEAKDAEARAPTGYADVLAKGDAAVGTSIAWKGEIVQASTQGHQAIAIVEIATGCPKRPCRARVVSAGASALPTGEKLGVYGRVAGLVALGDAKLPDVEADFVVKGP